LGYLLFRRVQGFFEAGARERELRQHLSALTANPRDAEAHHQLGLLHLARGDVEEARKHFQEAFRIDPSDPDYTYDMGRSYELKGEWPSACDFYEDTYRLDPVYRMRDVMREVGKSYLHTGELDKAVEFLQFFLESRGSDPEGRYWLAVALQERGNREEARLQLQTLLEQARSNPRFFRKGNRAWLYRARRLLRQAA
jgi:tetratricopeptide (TPR) repeat protein